MNCKVKHYHKTGECKDCKKVIAIASIRCRRCFGKHKTKMNDKKRAAKAWGE